LGGREPKRCDELEQMGTRTRNVSPWGQKKAGTGETGPTGPRFQVYEAGNGEPKWGATPPSKKIVVGRKKAIEKRLGNKKQYEVKIHHFRRGWKIPMKETAPLGTSQ